MKPRATYDPDADAIGIFFAPDGAVYDASEEIAPGVSLDFDADGRVIGVEITGVRRVVAGAALPRPGAAAEKPAAE